MELTIKTTLAIHQLKITTSQTNNSFIKFHISHKVKYNAYMFLLLIIY